VDSQYAVLQASASAIIKGIHLAILEREKARAAGDQAAVAFLTNEIQTSGQVYNGYVQRLLELEGPNSTYRFLDRVGDTIISGVKAGATFVVNAPAAAAKAAGQGLAGLLLPVLVPVGLLLVLAIFVAGKSGALRVTKAA